MRRLFMFLLFCFGLSLCSSQDIVKFNNADILEGKILEVQKKQITFQVSGQDTAITLPKTQILAFHYDISSKFYQTFSVEFFLGGAFASSSTAIKNILEEKGYGQTVQNSIFGLDLGSTDYPITKNLPSFGLSINFAIKAKSEIGLIFTKKEVLFEGFKNRQGYIHLKYLDHSFTPIYRHYSTYHRSYWEAGLPLILFNLKETETRGTNNAFQTFRPGVRFGGGISLSKKYATALQLRLNYTFTLPPFKIDPSKPSPYALQPFPLLHNGTISYHNLELAVVVGGRFRLSK